MTYSHREACGRCHQALCACEGRVPWFDRTADSEAGREAMLAELDGVSIRLRSVVDLDKYRSALAEIRTLREECKRLRTELAEANARSSGWAAEAGSATRAAALGDIEAAKLRAERDAALARAAELERERDDAFRTLESMREELRDTVRDWTKRWSIIDDAEADGISSCSDDIEELLDGYRITAKRGESPAEAPRPDALARIDTITDEQLEAQAAQAMAERPEPHGDCQATQPKPREEAKR